MGEVITVQEVVWPAPGKRQGKVIDTSGKRWQVWADKLAGYQVGNSYELLEVGTSNFNGQTYHTVKAAKPVTNITSAVPKLVSNATTQAHTMDHERRMDIFVCGAVNAILGNSAIDPMVFVGQPMVDVVNNLKKVWKMTLGPDAPKPPVARGQAPAELDDEIPF